MNGRFLGVFLALGLSMGAAHADVLAEWDIASVNGPSDPDASAINIAQGLSAVPLSATGVTPISTENWNNGAYPGSFAAKGWDTGSYNTDKYYSFSVTADAGTNVSISGISMSLTHGNFGGTGASNWVLRTSQDGFVSDVATYSTASAANNEQVFFDTTFASALEVLGGNDIEFRLYGYYPGSSSDYSGLANMVNGDYNGDIITGTGSNLMLYGTIPEPMTLSLIGSVAVAIVFVRRFFLI
ncbi:hypothetical protein P4B35_20065 [Pontiellaceae bacterium B12227]|nr:hypothetical protein [Pontiellaceae bacterium B12227]